MAQLEGVRIGPLDPDKAESFGQANASASVRRLMRHHNALYPPQLLGIMRLKRNNLRSDALDAGEVAGLVEDWYREDHDELPENFEVTGAAVRGEEDSSRKYVTFTYTVASGRTAKGALPYDDAFSASIEAGDEAIAIDKAKQAGMPWVPKQVAEALGGRKAGKRAEASNDAAVAQAENDDLRKKVEELERQLAEQREQGAPPPLGPAGAEGATEPETVDYSSEPWSGYDDANADVIADHLKAEGDPAIAQHVLAYEESGANRSTVTKAANAILDRPPSE